MHAIVMIFIPSSAEIQDEEIESSRIIFRCPCPSPGRKNYSVPNGASCLTLCIVHTDHAHFCCCLQRRRRKMAKIRRSLLHAGRYVRRYECDRDTFFTTVLRNSRRKDRYVSCVCAMHGTCTRSTKPTCVVIAKTRFPAISVLKREKFDFGAPTKLSAEYCSALGTRLTPSAIDAKLNEASTIRVNCCNRRGFRRHVHSKWKKRHFTPLAKNIKKTTGNENPDLGTWTFLVVLVRLVPPASRSAGK
jgi:hypothetical protein